MIMSSFIAQEPRHFCHAGRRKTPGTKGDRPTLSAALCNGVRKENDPKKIRIFPTYGASR
jgi:hypothetical protein